MAYQGSEFSHDDEDRIGVLITNLGTPNAPTKGALKTYLREFLADSRVVEFPRLLWWLVLNGIILNIRPGRSAKAYQRVWTDRGSPLMFHTRDQAEALQQELGAELVVDFAMRYGTPSIKATVDSMLNRGVRKLLVLPLYPQYSGSTTGSTFDALAEDFTKRRWLPDLRFISHYHDNAGYINALARSIEAHWQTHERADRLVFSFHGVPKRYLDKGDPYHCECHKTARLVAEKLNLKDDEYNVVFQSRFGREEWLRPYCDETLAGFPALGVKSVQVVCPGFSSDCLETIEEIGMENRDVFLEAGGERYEYIPALNAEPGHIKMLAELIRDNLQGWRTEPAAGRAARADQISESLKTG